MELAKNYIAVGTAQEDKCEPCVVVTTSSGVTIRMPEHDARKLADDILRNANYLWPIERGTKK